MGIIRKNDKIVLCEWMKLVKVNSYTLTFGKFLVKL